MTREELDKDLRVGDIVKITTQFGAIKGRVEELEESAIRLTICETGKPKRIDYNYITDYNTGRAPVVDAVSIGLDSKSKMVAIPGTNYRMGQTPVTQRLYKKVMGENPSYFQLSHNYEYYKKIWHVNLTFKAGIDRWNNLKRELDKQREALEKFGSTDNLPVENVSQFDAVYFCNKLSMMEGLTPAYSVDGETDPEYWGYTPHKGETLIGTYCNDDVSGYRLPTQTEWTYAAQGGKNYIYSGSNDLGEVGWYEGNSNNVPHPVARKMANGYGLYDMSGNVREWAWSWTTTYHTEQQPSLGGEYQYDANSCSVHSNIPREPGSVGVGFRLLRPMGETCSNCGAELRPGKKFCTKCGAKL